MSSVIEHLAITETLLDIEAVSHLYRHERDTFLSCLKLSSEKMPTAREDPPHIIFPFVEEITHF